MLPGYRLLRKTSLILHALWSPFQNRMTSTKSQLLSFQNRLMTLIQECRCEGTPPSGSSLFIPEDTFNELALSLACLQYQSNPYLRGYLDRFHSPPTLWSHWKEIPGIPTHVFKAYDWTCLEENERLRVFHSSGTTGEKNSRHWHSHDSLKLYEASLLQWARQHRPWAGDRLPFVHGVFLTPPPHKVPHSSLVHMFDTLARTCTASTTHQFVGEVGKDGMWQLPLREVAESLQRQTQAICLFGTAFLYVMLMDYLQEKSMTLSLPKGSLVFETGGYKGQTRALSKADFDRAVTKTLGVEPQNILGEYGMSELSSQAYPIQQQPGTAHAEPWRFHFPPWARHRILCPEKGHAVNIGETGMIQIIDLANVWSSISVLTEDLAIEHDRSFQWVGRATGAELRGCSLSTDLFT